MMSQEVLLTQPMDEEPCVDLHASLNGFVLQNDDLFATLKSQIATLKSQIAQMSELSRAAGNPRIEDYCREEFWHKGNHVEHER